METIIDLIFRGQKPDFNLVRDLLEMSDDFYLTVNDDYNIRDKSEVLKQFQNTDGENLNLALNHSTLNFGQYEASNSYINLIQENGESELLFYFDVNDLFLNDYKKAIDFLFAWGDSFLKRHTFFKEMICRIDEGNNSETFFTEKGWGPLYKKMWLNRK